LASHGHDSRRSEALLIVVDHLAFGLRDLGLGEPELGYVSLHELAEVRGPLGLPLERDLYFAPTRTIAAYADLAREHRRIVT
jgi:hypothetical protein